MTAALALAAHIEQCEHCATKGRKFYWRCPAALTLLREAVLEGALLRDSARKLAMASLPLERYGTTARIPSPKSARHRAQRAITSIAPTPAA